MGNRDLPSEIVGFYACMKAYFASLPVDGEKVVDEGKLFTVLDGDDRVKVKLTRSQVHGFEIGTRKDTCTVVVTHLRGVSGPIAVVVETQLAEVEAWMNGSDV